MKRFCFCLVLFVALVFVQLSNAALDKTPAAVDEWAAVAQNTVREGTNYDISDCYSSKLHIDFALTAATAHTGTNIEVQVSSNTVGSASDEDWSTLIAIESITGTANPEALAGAEAAGQTVLEVASTTGYEADGAIWIFLLDNTVADSELCYLVSHEGTPSVTVLDGLTHAPDDSDTLYNLARTYTIPIPIEYNRVRVIIDNTLDSNGSSVHTRTRISRVLEY